MHALNFPRRVQRERCSLRCPGALAEACSAGALTIASRREVGQRRSRNRANTELQWPAVAPAGMWWKIVLSIGGQLQPAAVFRPASLRH